MPAEAQCLGPRDRLRDRLRRAVGPPAPAAAGTAPPRDGVRAFGPAAATARPELGVANYLPGFWQDTPAGRVFVVEQRFELEHAHGALSLGKTLDVAPALLARL